jgi:hypothetical protein
MRSEFSWAPSKQLNIAAFESVGLALGARVEVTIHATTQEEEDDDDNDDANGGSDQATVNAFLLTSPQQTWFQLQRASSSDAKDTAAVVCAPPAAARAELAVGMPKAQRATIRVPATGQYFLHLGYCGPRQLDRLTASASFVNPTRDGRLVEHLPVEQAMLPHVYSAAALVYASLLLVWVAECWRRKERFEAWHLSIPALVLLKVAASGHAARYYASLSTTGRPSPAGELTKELLHGFFSWVFPSALLAFSAPRGAVASRLRGSLALISLGYLISIALRVRCHYDEGDSDCDGVDFAEWLMINTIFFAIFILINHGIQNRVNEVTGMLPPVGPEMANAYEALRVRMRLRECFVASILAPALLFVVEASALFSWENACAKATIEEFLFIAIWIFAGFEFPTTDVPLSVSSRRSRATREGEGGGAAAST